MNSDELLAAMEADELEDQAELGKMSVREYARMKEIAPQLLYYYIRQGHIKQEVCVCGRKVIDVPSADAYLAEKEKKATEKAGGVTASE